LSRARQIKPLVVGLALEKGLIKPESMIQTAPGKLSLGGHTISDAHPHALLSVNEVIQKSEQRRHGEDRHAVAVVMTCGRCSPRSGLDKNLKCLSQGRWPGDCAVTKHGDRLSKPP